MSTASAHLTVSGVGVDVIYKDIKNLHIGVYPPAGRVRVAAPERLGDEAVRLAIVQRLPWIKKRTKQLRNAERQSEREMVTGESHYLWGERLRLEVIPASGRPSVSVRGSRLLLTVAPGTTAIQRQRLVETWQRAQLKAAIPALIEKWQPIVGRTVEKWTVRRMKTKWGSCNPQSAHISLNLELVKKHPSCLEYIVVHEMTHLHDRTHDEHFRALLDDYLPNWRAQRDDLNRAPLAHEEWSW
jgi:predicted metal-dependent hydrolase